MTSKTLKASVLIGGTVSSAFRGALKTAGTGLREIGAAITAVDKRQRLLAQSINTFGRMGKNVDGLRAQYAALVIQSEKLRASQQRLANVQNAIDANQAKRAALRGAMFDAVAAAAVVSAPIRAAIKFEDAMQGVAKQVAGARDESGKLTDVYFGMAKQIQVLGREIPMATNDIARMVESAARMGVAKDGLIEFTRTAAMMAVAFDAPADELAERMAKVAGLFKIPIPQIGGLADAINYLDDETVAKGGDIIDFLTRTGGVAGSVKVTGQEMAALGATLLGLGERTETAGTATNAIVQKLAAADKGSKKFRRAMDELGLSTSAVQNGMQKDAIGTMRTVLAAVGKLPKSKQLGVMVDLVGLEHSDTLAKLANNTEALDKNLSMLNDGALKDSMSREFKARLAATSAQWQIMKNRITEVAVNLGGALLPALNGIMASVGPVVSRFADWARANPGLVKGIVGAAAALTSLRVASLGIGYAMTFIRGPILGAQKLFAKFRAGQLLASMGRFGPVAMRVGGVLRMIGTAMAAIGGGPLALIVAGLTAVGLIVRKYWQPIAAWVTGFASGVRDALAPAFAQVGAALAPLKPLWDGLVSGLRGAWDWFVKLLEPVKLTGKEVAGATESGRGFGKVVGQVISVMIGKAAWLVRTFIDVGIKVASVAMTIARAFASAFGGIVAGVKWVVQKAAPLLGLAGSIGSALGIGSDQAAAGAAPAGKAPLPSLPKSTGRGGRSGASTTTNQFNITQLPGESSEELARRIVAEQERRQAAKSRGSLADKVD